MRQAISFVLLLLLFSVFGNSVAFSVPQSKTYQKTRKILSAMDDVRNDHDKLAALFSVGDERIQDLILALDDPDTDISLRAQIVIRYLGSAKGMKSLIEWYNKRPNGHPIAGPIPLPLTEWDYQFIDSNLISRSPDTWKEIGVQYIYALAIDDADRSKRTLDAIVKNAGSVNENTFVGKALQQIQTGRPKRLIAVERDLAREVLENAFFISAKDHKHATAHLLGLDGKKDKALVELYINRGRLSQEWYHVVMSKCGQGWSFFSITQVAIS